MKTDPSQADAIRHGSGPAMVLAGPGSGKTTVITHRVQQLIRSGIDPSSILVITFSKAAAREMQERFLLLMGRQRFPVTFGTFHAVFFQILKTAYGYRADQIVREETRISFLRDFLRRLRIETGDETDFIKQILSALGRIKNTGEDPAQCAPAFCDPEVFLVIWRAYGEFLSQNRYLDFDDMLLLTKELFDQRPDILSAWQRRFRYILVDEFQDINPIQYEIVRMLALPENNLFIVGDDDQSIYRFRGSSPGIMLHFKEEYPDAKQVFLSTNYRSVPGIVDAAGKLISHNKNRYQKEIRAAANGGALPVAASFLTQREENQFVIETIRGLHETAGVPFDEMAVLFRTNAQPTLLALMMSNNQIPFLYASHLPHLFDHWITADLNAYLALGAGDRSRAAFLHILNRPWRGLTRESLPYEEVTFPAWASYYREDVRMTDVLKNLEQDLLLMQDMRPWAAINYIRKAVGYEDYVMEFAKEHRIRSGELVEILDELQKDAADFDNFDAWRAHQKEETEKWKASYSKENREDPAVAFHTFHAAKGLEYDTVFLIDVNERVIPDKKAVSEEEIEEERRLFYVGMTRARRRLYLLYSVQIKNKTMAPSRFLSESGMQVN